MPGGADQAARQRIGAAAPLATEPHPDRIVGNANGDVGQPGLGADVVPLGGRDEHICDRCLPSSRVGTAEAIVAITRPARRSPGTAPTSRAAHDHALRHAGARDNAGTGVRRRHCPDDVGHRFYDCAIAVSHVEPVPTISPTWHTFRRVEPEHVSTCDLVENAPDLCGRVRGDIGRGRFALGPSVEVEPQPVALEPADAPSSGRIPRRSRKMLPCMFEP